LAIRERVVSHLPHIDPKLADRVAKGLGLHGKIHAATAVKETRNNLKASKALSIILNGPKSFAGRKVGVLVTEGADREVFDALKSEVEAEGAMVEVVAPAVGGVTASDGALIEAQQKIGGGPSVLYDAVAIIAAAEGVQPLLSNASAKDFVSDAFAHLKFIAYVDAAIPLFAKAGIEIDEGFIPIGNGKKGAAAFVAACRKLRMWDREAAVTT
jgi:catalase